MNEKDIIKILVHKPQIGIFRNARKEHQCTKCHGLIAKKERYLTVKPDFISNYIITKLCTYCCVNIIKEREIL